MIFSLKGNVHFSTHMEVAMLMRGNVSQESIWLVQTASSLSLTETPNVSYYEFLFPKNVFISLINNWQQKCVAHKMIDIKTLMKLQKNKKWPKYILDIRFTLIKLKKLRLKN